MATPTDARFKGFLELDLDGTSVLAFVTNLAEEDKVICLHTAHTIDEAQAEVHEYLSEVYWDFDPEVHIYWTSQIPPLVIERKLLRLYAGEMERFSSFENKFAERREPHA